MSKAKLKDTTELLPVTTEPQDAITDEMMASLEARYHAAKATAKTSADALTADKAAHAAFLHEALLYGSKCRTDRDKVKINKTLDVLHGLTRDGKSKSLKKSQSQVIHSPEVHAMIRKNNGDVMPETVADIAKSIGYVDAKGHSKTHTMTSLSDGSPNSPIVKARAVRTFQASTETAADRHHDVRKNPATGPILVEITKLADKLRDGTDQHGPILRDTMEDGENRSPYSSFIETNIDMLHAMIDVK